MTVWDKHEDFLAEEAAGLVVSGSSEIAALLSLMRNSYVEAYGQLALKYACLYEGLEVEGDAEEIIYRANQDQLPEDWLYSNSLHAYHEVLFGTPDNSHPDEDAIKDAQLLYRAFQKEKSGNHPVMSSQFEIQQFSRKEIDRWLLLNDISSQYAFVPTEPRPYVQPIDPSVLATPKQLLAAFESWGLKERWFDEPKKHLWLLHARKVLGKGGNRPIPPLYCPYEVMVGLRTKTRSGRKPFSEDKGLKVLKAHFPATFNRLEGFLPPDDRSNNSP